MDAEVCDCPMCVAKAGHMLMSCAFGDETDKGKIISLSVALGLAISEAEVTLPEAVGAFAHLMAQMARSLVPTLPNSLPAAVAMACTAELEAPAHGQTLN